MVETYSTGNIRFDIWTCTCMLKFLPISPVKHWYNIMFRFYFTWDFNMCVTVFTLQMMTGNK